MTKRLMFTGATAAFLVAAIALVGAQGRRGPGGQFGPGQGPDGRGQMLGGPDGQMRGPGGGFGQFRGGPGFGRGGRMGGGPMAGLAGVGLTDDQREQVRGILDAQRDSARETMGALGDARRSLHDAIFAATPDAGAIAAAQAKLAEAETAQIAAHVKAQTAIAAILTPEQKAKLIRK